MTLPFSGFVRRVFILPLTTYGYSLTAQLMVNSVAPLLCSSSATLGTVTHLLFDSLAIILAPKQNWSHFALIVNTLWPLDIFNGLPSFVTLSVPFVLWSTLAAP